MWEACVFSADYCAGFLSDYSVGGVDYVFEYVEPVSDSVDSGVFDSDKAGCDCGVGIHDKGLRAVWAYGGGGDDCGRSACGYGVGVPEVFDFRDDGRGGERLDSFGDLTFSISIRIFIWEIVGSSFQTN